MRAANQQKQSTRLAALAKKNAEYWVLGASDQLDQETRGPLEMFSGGRLFEAFTGIRLGPGGQKRAREAEEASAEPPRRVRSRTEGITMDDIGRDLNDNLNDNFLMNDDDTIEQGREAPTPLDERQASSIFPWNQSAGSRRPTSAHANSASIAPGSLLDKAVRHASRLTSASPLVGRGIADAGPDDFQLGLEHSDYAEDVLADDQEFEMYGPAAQVDTQTAAQSQWQRATLDGESANFLDFVRTAVESSGENNFQSNKDVIGSVDFGTLLPPHQSRIVAAQAFLHLLTLGSRGMVKVKQEKAFGTISMGVVIG